MFTSGSAMVRMLVCRTGAITAVDSTIAPAVMSEALANTTAAVLDVKSAACVPDPVVTPVATVSVHEICALKVATAAWKVRAAFDIPGADPVTENVVDPHPDFDGVAKVPNV